MSNRNYALLWCGQLISEIGNRFHWVAVSLWVYAVTGSATAVSIAISSMFAGSLLFGLWAGVYVDRFNRKSIMIVADLVRAALVALIPYFMAFSIWLVYADLIFISIATAFFRPAIFSVVPQIVKRRDLLSANSFFSAMDTGTEIVGPALAGILAFKYGYALLLYLDAITYAASAVLITAMSLPSLSTRNSQRLDLHGVWSGVVEGLRYIRRDNLQWGLFILIFPAQIVGSGLNALQTPLAKGEVGITDAEFGTFQSIWGVGFVLASLFLGWYGANLSRERLIISGYFLSFVMAALMGLSRSLEGLLITGFGVGLANTLYFVGLSTVIMERSPQEMMGRVISTRQAAVSSIRVMAPMIFGALADTIGVRGSIVLMATIAAVGTTAVMLTVPAVRGRKASVPSARPCFHPWQIVIAPVSPDFDTGPQRKLNAIAVAILVLVFIGLSYLVPPYGIGLLVTISLMAAIGVILKRRGWLP